MVKLFRDISLERLASPEQLDTLITITDTKAWVALISIAGLLLAVIAWGIWGSIPTRVDGMCVLIEPGGLSTVSVARKARIDAITVKADDMIEKGQVLATLTLFDQQAAIIQTQEELTALRIQAKSSQAYHQQRQKHLNEHIHTLQAQLQAQQAQAKTNPDIVLSLQQKIQDSQAKLDEAYLAQISIEEHIKAKALHLKLLQEHYQKDRHIRAPTSGHVIELKASVGDVVAGGTDLLSLEHLEKDVHDLHALIYVSSLDGKTVHPDMAALIAPSIVHREKYGALQAKVTRVSIFPKSFSAIMRTLQNEDLVKQMMEKGAPIEVEAILIPADTLSGYAWTSRKGPPISIQSGTLCTAKITTKVQSPISLVIPFVKLKSGL